MTGTSTCSRFEELLLEFAYGELHGPVEQDVSTHVSSCARCQAELAKVSSTRAAMKLLAPQEAPPSGLESLLAAAERAAKARAASAPRKSLFQRWLVPGAVTAFALTLVVAVTGVLVQSGPPVAGAKTDIPESIAASPEPATATVVAPAPPREEEKQLEKFEGNKEAPPVVSAHAASQDPSLKAKADLSGGGYPGDALAKSGSLGGRFGEESARKDLPAGAKAAPKPAASVADLKQEKAEMKRAAGPSVDSVSLGGAPSRDRAPVKAPAYRSTNDFDDGLVGFGGGVGNQAAGQAQAPNQKKSAGPSSRSKSGVDEQADKSIARLENAKGFSQNMAPAAPPPAAVSPQAAPPAIPRQQAPAAAGESLAAESRREEPRKMRPSAERAVATAKPPAMDAEDERNSQGRVEALLAQARADEDRDPVGAASRYEELSRLNPSDTRAGLWMYQAGLLYERANLSQSALTAYAKVQQEFHQSPYAPQAAMRSAALNETLRRVEQAEHGYEQIPLQYPGTREAAQAQQRLSSLRQQRVNLDQQRSKASGQKSSETNSNEATQPAAK